MRDAKDLYEYMGTYYDNIFAGFKDPGELMKALRSLPHDYKVIGGDQPTYHLGGDIYRDNELPDGTFCWGAKTYIQRLVNNYEHLFGF